MFKPFSLYIGTRYTNLKRRDHFITFISLVSMVGIALGVMVLITVLSVMNGFTKEIRERILSVTPQLMVNGWGNQAIEDPDSLSQMMLDHPMIEAVGPYIEGQGMMTQSTAVRGVLVKGIDPTTSEAVFPLRSTLVAGSVDELQSGRFGVILGDGLARALGLGIGDKVTLLIPELNVSLVGAMPRLKQLKVIGIFKVGYVYDSGMAFVHLNDAQKLYKVRDGVTGIQAKLSDPFKSRQVAYDLKVQTQDGYYVVDWTKLNETYFSAVAMEKKMMFLTLMLILAIAVFNLISTLVMVVTDKKSDIAILRTLGASKRKIMAIFICQGAVIGVIGTFFGVVLGILLALNVETIVAFIEQMFHTKFIAEEVYFLNYLPSDLQANDVILITITSLALSLLATIIPAYRASGVQPAEALRYEHG